MQKTSEITEQAVPHLSFSDALSMIIYRDPLTVHSSLARKYGDIYHFKAGREDVYFLAHPDAIRELLVVQHEKFRKGGGVMLLGRMLGRGLITNDGSSHKQQRRLVQPAFHRKRIASYATAMVEAAQQKSQSWRDSEIVDISTEMLHLTLVVVGKTLFNTDVEKEADTFHHGLSTAMEAFRKIGLSPWGDVVGRLPFPINKRLQQARENLDTVVYRIIEEHRQAGNDQGDLLSMLLQARYEDGTAMDDRQLRDEVMTLFLAGHETVSNALTWTWYLLAQHPEVRTKLLQEVDSVLGKHPATIEDLPRLIYTERVITESMRLYPPVWAIDRRVNEEVVICGARIPAGARIIMSQYAVQHDKRFYPDPTRFDPDRWSPEEQAKRPKFAYFPFGGGPRLCLGESFAWTESILLLATLSQAWEANLTSRTRIKIQPAVTLRPQYGIHMKLAQRPASAP